MDQIWLVGVENNDSCEEYSIREGSDTDSEVAACHDMESYVDEAVL